MATAEVFRFVTVRPPQDVDILQQNAGASVDLGVFTTAFADTLRSLRRDGDRADMIGTATALINGTTFVDSAKKIDKPYLDFLVAVRALTDQSFFTGAGTAFGNAFNKADPAAHIKTDAFIAFHGRVADSIVAATIVPSVPTKTRELLTTTARALWLIRRLAAKSSLSRTVFNSAPLALPRDIFPLPPATTSTGELRAAATGRASRAQARAQRRVTLSANLEAHRQALDELLAGVDAFGTSVLNGSRTGFGLPDAALRTLTESTRAVLTANGVPETGFDLARTVALLETRASGLARSLHSDAGPDRQVVRIGNTFLTRSGLDTAVAADPADSRTPGPCAPAPAALPVDGVTVPTGHGDAKVLGIADLNLVEQNLLRYELGEVAHIENVLRGETRSRTFRTSHTTTQTETVETETTQEKEQDLSSTDRFELQTESQSVINENASTQAGLTIHASYGPSVDATSNFNFSSSSSRQQSDTASASFAREISTKAVNRVQTRSLTRRTTTTTDVVEETDVHAFENRNGNNDISGVYRFVDKVYRAQVVNYGKRLMLEFVVPEPAAFLRHVAGSRPVTGVSQTEPEPPGYCLAGGTTFQPLQVTDIRPDSYQMWAAKYGAQDVSSPPPALVLATAGKKSPDKMDTLPDSSQGDGQENRKISSDVFAVTIPDGYQTQTATVNIFGETQKGTHRIVVQVAGEERTYIEPGQDPTGFDLSANRASSVDITLNTLAFHNWEAVAVVFCKLSAEKLQEWQLKTFNSIMTAYANLKSRFDEAVAEARLQARNDAAITGANPAINRETEQTELKKGCLQLLTGQKFDLFDAVTGNQDPFGYPEMDLDEAKAEGAYIQVFEQSFEWNNMTYIFYPYFWGRKQEWPVVSQLSDDDPLFARFLRAGAARVQVPVRLGFENRILTYLSTGELWAGAGALVNSDSDSADVLHLSIVDELKSQQGDNNVDGPGTVTVTKDKSEVTGVGTAFSSDDVNRRISIGGTVFVIKSVTDEQNIRLTTAYTGRNDSGLAYSMGGKLVGESWEVKLPTSLVKLDNSLPIS
ncbi:hypothetical protein [Actinoplanes sp. NPDC026670]|uniref:hypothetical protein n=1 Tax=Actinoplanes sp. NPDC026670 TaxID=3154700 RepID=UPI0033CB0C1F